MGGNRVALARMRTERLLLVACSVLLVVGSTATAALITLETDAREQGLRDRWRAASGTERAVEISTATEGLLSAGWPDEGTEAAALRQDVTDAGLGRSGTGVHVLAAARTAPADVTVPAPSGASSVVLMSFDDLPALATLVDGRWPAPDSAPRAGEPVPATLQADAAASLGVGAGDTVGVDVGADGPSLFEVVGTWRVGDIVGTHGSPSGTTGLGEAGVAGSVLELTGRLTTSTVGPLVPSDPRAMGPATRVWRVVPRTEGLTTGGATALASALGRLESRVRSDPRLPGASVDGEARDLLPGLARAVVADSSSARVALLVVGVVAGVSTMLVGGLLAGRRGGQTRLARSRGAAWHQVAAWSAVESVVLALPALVVAAGLVVLGLPVAGSAVAVAALAGAGLIAVPALLDAARNPAIRQAPRAVPAVAMTGGAVLVVTAALVTSWLLRRHGTTPGGLRDVAATSSPFGGDPLVVLAPALGLLAGGMVVARLVGPAARTASRLLDGRGRAVPLLAAWSASRAPAAQVVAVLLVTVAVGGVVLASGQDMLRRSETDRVATQQVGADLRVTATSAGTAADAERDAGLGVATAVAAVDGVVSVTAVHTEQVTTAVGPAVVATTTWASDAPLPGDPPVGVRAPSGAVVEIDQTVGSSAPGAGAPEVTAQTWWVSTDGYVVARPVSAGADPEAGARVSSVVELPATPRRDTGEAAEWELVAVDVTLPPGEVGRTFSYSIEGIRGEDGELRRPVPEAWVVASDPVPGLTALSGGLAGVSAASGPEPLTVRLRPRSLGAVPGTSPGALPATVTADLARALGREEGETLHLGAGSAGGSGGVTAVDVVTAVPGLGAPAVVLPARAAALAAIARGGRPDAFESWTVDLAPSGTSDEPAREGVRDAVRDAASAAGTEVAVTDRRSVAQDILSDPVAVSADRATWAGAGATGVLALVGVAAAAAAGSGERRRDEVLLAVLGASGAQTRRARTAQAVAVGLLTVGAGLLVGLAVLWWCGPALVGDPSRPGLPSTVGVRVPWPGLAGAALVGALLVCLPALRRRPLGPLGPALRRWEIR